MKKFYIDDVPESHTVTSWLKLNTNWVDLMKITKAVNNLPKVICFKIDDFNPDKLADSILESTKIYGDHGWKTSGGESLNYTGFSLVYNPLHQDKLDPHSSTLGTPKNSVTEFFWNITDKHEILKNSYFDGYGFNTPTPASEFGELGKFMQRCRSTRVRSRLSILNGHIFDEDNVDAQGWHKDEPIFENLRINIPLTTNENYYFQIEKHNPVHLPVGHAYSWNTFVPHRVFNGRYNQSRRIHLVLGFSPWWDYLPNERAWQQNKFYGIKHPFDMLVDGDVFDGLTVDLDKKIY